MEEEKEELLVAGTHQRLGVFLQKDIKLGKINELTI
jgi:hypothetical protein